MSIYAISDLHLSSDNKKSMEVFGDKWTDYMNRIKENWVNSITKEDIVIMPGDISWGMYIEESVDDFVFLNELPGTKVILKGNHDYWWETISKLNKFISDNLFNNILFLNNNSYLFGDTLICGTRGWNSPDSEGFSKDDEKIFSREVQRLKLSLESSMSKNYNNIITAFHYPPFDSNGSIIQQIKELLVQYNVRICLYGHLHGESTKCAVEGEKEGIEFKLVSADYLGFKPVKVI